MDAVANQSTPADLLDGPNRKRKIGVVGLTKSSTKVFHPMTSTGENDITPKDIVTSFIDHQKTVYSTDIAPTPCGTANMPPTPAFGTRSTTVNMPPTPAFGARPSLGSDAVDIFDDTPIDEQIGTALKKHRTYNGFGETCTSSEDGSKSHKTPSPAPTAAIRPTSISLRNFSNWKVPPRYKLVRLLGKGSYGQVAEAYDTVGLKKVAIKKIVNVFEQEIDCKRLYREIYILRHLQHPQVITLLDVIPPENNETFTDLYLVFEFVDTDLHKLIMSPQYLTIRHIQVFLYQLLCGLKYIHSANVIHRDMKPANILLNEDCTLMICDFGLSRVMEPNKPTEDISKHLYSPNSKNNGQASGGVQAAITPTSAGFTQPSPQTTPRSAAEVPKFRRQLTKHVVTRWYRAPELILLQDYNFAVDMWSIGCIFAELLSMQVESCPRYQERAPLFPGRSCFPLSADRPTTYSDKLDQLNVIFNVIGTPREEDIGYLGEVKQYLRKLPKKEPKDLKEMYPGAPIESLDLLKKMLAFNPENRISVDDALAHPFLSPVRRRQSENNEQNPFSMEFENFPLNKETLKGKHHFTSLIVFLSFDQKNTHKTFLLYCILGRIYEEIQFFAKKNNSQQQ
jgi:mitogen-activated protein kinase 1/3